MGVRQELGATVQQTRHIDSARRWTLSAMVVSSALLCWGLVGTALAGSTPALGAGESKLESSAQKATPATKGAGPVSAATESDASGAAKAPDLAALGVPSTYVGSEKCVSCHVNQGETFSRTLMGRIFLKNPRSHNEKLGCESCHGPGSAHVAAGGRKDEGEVGGLIAFRSDSPRPVEERNAVCLTCHENGLRTHWRGSQHQTRGLACTNCHQIMDKVSPKNQFVKATEVETCAQCHKDRRAQLWRSSHMPVREGKLQCSSCHNPHGTANQKLLKELTVNETCYTCHAEKRGPFLWNHPPQIESCANCHDPHGSNHENMLKTAKPRICQQCHVPTQHPTRPYGRDAASLKFVLGQSCLTCHINIHGSNHPAGYGFTR
jgi:DmsE family decaheme c-type cytochrome